MRTGGVHSGAAVSSLIWFLVFTGYLWTAFSRRGFTDLPVLAFDVILTVLLLSIVVTAIPQMRRRYHDMFESAHRWAGWLSIALFWVALVLFARDDAKAADIRVSLGKTLTKLPYILDALDH